MNDLNICSIIGRLTRNILEKDFAYTTNGKARLNISLAVNNGYGDNKHTSYFDVVVWGKTAETIRQFLSKGKQICINGKLRQERWEKHGQKNSKIVIVAETVQLLGNYANTSNSERPQVERPVQYDSENYSSELYSDDIPF